jgi:hypothetical protein
MNSQETQIEYGDSIVQTMNEMRHHINLGHLSKEEQDDAYIWACHTYQIAQKDNEKWSYMLKATMPLLPIRLMRGKWTPSYFRMSEWIGFQSARHLTERYTDLLDGRWQELDTYVKTRRIGLPIEKESPHYGSHIRLDDDCQYWEETLPKIGAILDGEVITDLCNNSPILGEIKASNRMNDDAIGRKVLQALLDCTYDQQMEAKKKWGRQATGHSFAIMPTEVVRKVLQTESLNGGVDREWDEKKGVGTISWGESSGGVRIYSHSDLKDKIVVGFRPDDRNLCPYLYRPYSFGLMEGPDIEGHAYQGKMQLLHRYVKKLVDRGGELYGVILYNSPKATLDIREVLCANPLRDSGLGHYLREHFAAVRQTRSKPDGA